jgi:hypothetical protein
MAEAVPERCWWSRRANQHVSGLNRLCVACAGDSTCVHLLNVTRGGVYLTAGGSFATVVFIRPVRGFSLRGDLCGPVYSSIA